MEKIDLISRFNQHPSPKNLKIIIITGLILTIVFQVIMKIFVDLSGAPMELYLIQQLSFDGDYIKTKFYFLTSDFEMYKLFLAFDYGYLIGYGLSIFSISVFLARNFEETSRIRSIGYYFALAGLVAACCDAIENLIALLTLSNPFGFPNWLAIIHSVFALIKWISVISSLGYIIFMMIFLLNVKIRDFLKK